LQFHVPLRCANPTLLTTANKLTGSVLRTWSRRARRHVAEVLIIPVNVVLITNRAVAIGPLAHVIRALYNLTRTNPNRTKQAETTNRLVPLVAETIRGDTSGVGWARDTLAATIIADC
jgi:hypothetical protein